ncbi:MAG: hypothetical protein A3B30_02760 [Candidatus Komeilibacteria bacterium RIFCSPLOWO2_01_FULL_52_15]|uniref:HMA domain-containing protein n=2 Tax=Candidatus Komeiliibacteriota TaxID=1817908 RepID=A0A1G2BNI4_9BACT|nr:MAG: hypothetical protein A2677_02085 [Candidatus Komeilibacteria bacterium RIFCSPHIGHO2_01_FULL_52_14]OGY90658.1 MAG: hypothetical protein A3B30_02760 [Candidatus Komeilibacteria bacterium RIFCSPLOWO2_01_FULL_52_15]
MQHTSSIERIDFMISGMHCASCEVLIERKFKKIPGVERVSVNNATGRAKVYCSRTPSLEELNNAVNADGYSVQYRNHPPVKQECAEPRGEHYAEIGGIAIIVVGLYLIIQQLHIAPPNFGVSDTMSYGFVFLLGLIAAVSTCLAVTGGLLIATATRYNERHAELTGVQKFKPHLYFNIGRVVSYTVFGAVVGALGSVISLSTRATGILTIVASIVMVVLGLQLLDVFPFLRRMQLKLPKRFAHRIHDASNSEHRAAPFFLGASTFFLPCGFTQTLQLYVLTLGSPMRGALTMLFFALGTLPALMSLSVLTSFSKGLFLRYFVKVAGVLVVLMGVLNVSGGFALAGVPLDPRTLFAQNTAPATEVPMRNGKQIAEMRVEGYEYYPSRFTVKAGVPVDWLIDGRKAQGCAQVLIVPKLGITRRLSRDAVTTISFTPKQDGTLEFSCSMGMTTPGARFTVVSGSA